jgi:hypothetical protein
MLELKIGKEFALITRFTILKEGWPSLECQIQTEVLNPRKVVKGCACLEEHLLSLKG